VLVIGGGDGGVVREILKHPCVETVTHCEIDEVNLLTNLTIFFSGQEALYTHDGCDL